MSRSSYDQIGTDIEIGVESNLESAVMQGAEERDDISNHHNHEKVIWELYGCKLKLGQLKYFTFMLNGIALLWPWNCFLSASEFFRERFEANAKLADSYSSTMMTISTITSLVGNYLLSQKQVNVNYTKRAKAGQYICALAFFMLSMSCILKTDVNPGIYYAFVMVLVFTSALAICISQNGVMALVNVLGEIYANGVMVGQSLAGVLPSITLIISVLGSNLSKPKLVPQSDFGVALYFFSECIVSLSGVFFMKLVAKFDDIAYDELVQNEEPIAMMDNTTKLADNNEADISQDQERDPLQNNNISSTHGLAVTGDTHIPFSYLWSKLKIIVVTIFLTFAVTLIFPVFASTVESTNYQHHPNSKLLSKKVFIPFIFLIWNIGDLGGRVMCAWKYFKISNPKTLIAYSLSRLLFLPLFFLCNIKNQGAVIDSDLFYILLQFAFGLTNGHLCSSCFMNIGRFVEGENEQKAAGGFTTVFLSSGLAFGSVMSYIFVWGINS